MLVSKEICAVGLRHGGGGGQWVSCGHAGSGKEDKESQIAETSHMNKEEEKGPEALKARFQGVN